MNRASIFGSRSNAVEDKLNLLGNRNNVDVLVITRDLCEKSKIYGIEGIYLAAKETASSQTTKLQVL